MSQEYRVLFYFYHCYVYFSYYNLLYSAGVFYNPNRPRLTKAMAPKQAQALRVVLRAYKATPTRTFELDAYCPPLDIYLDKWLADFEQGMQLSGLGQKLRQTVTYIATRLWTRRPRRDRRKQLEGTY